MDVIGVFKTISLKKIGSNPEVKVTENFQHLIVMKFYALAKTCLLQVQPNSGNISFLIYMAASKCSRNHFISEKCKTVQSFTPHFLQNKPLMQIPTSSSDCKSVINIPGSHIVKAFSALPSHFHYFTSITKALSLQCYFILVLAIPECFNINNKIKY